MDKPAAQPIAKIVAVGFIVFSTVVATLIRLSCPGFGILIAFITLPFFIAFQIWVYNIFKKHWDKQPLPAIVLGYLLSILFMVAFFFQEDGGDDMSGYPILMRLVINNIKGLENLSWVAMIAYLICLPIFGAFYNKKA